MHVIMVCALLNRTIDKAAVLRFLRETPRETFPKVEFGSLEVGYRYESCSLLVEARESGFLTRESITNVLIIRKKSYPLATNKFLS